MTVERAGHFAFGLSLLLAALGPGVRDATAAPRTATGEPPKVEAALLAETTSAPAVGTLWVGLRQEIAEGWHTYWRYPGDSGLPTQVEWKLPPGVKAGPLRWPRPKAYTVGPLVNFGYADEVLLLAPIEIAPEARLSGTLSITAEADWLVCREICIPERKTLVLELPVAGAAPATDPRSAPLFERYRALLPERSPWKATAARAGKRLELRLAVPAAEARALSGARFFPGREGLIENPAPQSVSIDDTGMTIGLTAGARVGRDLEEFEGLLVVESGGDGPIRKRDFLIGPVPIAMQQDGR